MNLNCEIEVWSDVEHFKQIYTGFSLLHRSGFLTLKQVIPSEACKDMTRPKRWTDYKFFNAKVILNDGISIVYDVHDWNWIDEEILSGVDFYFKRSFDSNYVSNLTEGSKVFPLGLNYPVSTTHKDTFKLQRSRLYSGKAKIKAIAKGLGLDRFGYGETEGLDNLEAMPDFKADPKVLFMAKAWSPESIEDKKQKEVVEAINEARANCVRILRAEFRDRFYGGLARDDYSLSNFADCVLPDSSLSNKRNYLDILKGFPICVATTGLNNSNGWKLAEYVALSKAIITEPLFFQVPGDFAKERNYLEFSTPEDLVKAAFRLFEDKNLCLDIMINNYRYYQAYLRPDSLILNTLAVVFANCDLFA